MPDPSPQKKRQDAASSSATAWFAVLERARRTDDYDLAARAQRELKRLGVHVKFKRPVAGIEGR